MSPTFCIGDIKVKSKIYLDQQTPPRDSSAPPVRPVVNVEALFSKIISYSLDNSTSASCKNSFSII